MLDHFLAVAVRHDHDREQSVKLAADLQRLPNDLLYRLATGKEKLSFGTNEEWLEKYHGTPLFEQALQLEHADLENDVARQQADSARPAMDQFYKTQDQIRIQKKMLDLQLIETQEKDGLQVQPGGMLPETTTPTAQGSGALGDVAAEGVQDGAPGNAMGAKMASTVNAWNAMARNANIGSAVGGALGAGAGALHGFKKDEQGQRHIGRGIAQTLGGGVGGAFLGAGAGAVGTNLRQGLGVKDSFSRAGHAMVGSVPENVISAVEQEQAAARAAKVAAARDVLALQAMKPYLSGALYSAPPGISHADMADLAAEYAREDHAHLNERAAFAKEHPVRNRLGGALPGGIIGGALGGYAGSPFGAQGTAIGAGLGALAGGSLGALATPGYKERQARADELGGHLQHATPRMLSGSLQAMSKERAAEEAREHAMDLAEAGASRHSVTVHNKNKNASANFEKAAISLSKIEHTALSSAGNPAALERHSAKMKALFGRSYDKEREITALAEQAAKASGKPYVPTLSHAAGMRHKAQEGSSAARFALENPEQALAHAAEGPRENLSMWGHPKEVSKTVVASANFEKAALSLAGIGNAAMGMAKANPGAAIGAGIGAVGGLAHGLRKDQNGQRHILGGLAQGVAGGVAGGAVGHVAGRVAGNVGLARGLSQQAVAAGAAPASVGQQAMGVLRNTGHQLGQDARSAAGAVQGAANTVMGKVRGAVPGAAPAAAPAPNPAAIEQSLASKFGSALSSLP